MDSKKIYSIGKLTLGIVLKTRITLQMNLNRNSVYIKIITLIIGFACGVGNLCAQGKIAFNTERSAIYRLIGKQEFDSANIKIEALIKRTKAKKQSSEYISALLVKAFLKQQEGERQEGMNMLLLALKSCSLTDTAELIGVHARFAGFYYSLGAIPLALAHYEKEYQLRIKFKKGKRNLHTLFVLSRKLGLVAYKAEKYKTARKYYKEALTLSKGKNVASMLNNIGLTYRAEINYDSATLFFLDGIRYLEQPTLIKKDRDHVYSLLYSSMGGVALEQGDLFKAIEMYESSRRYSREDILHEEYLSTLNKLCRLYLDVQKIDRAKAVIEELDSLVTAQKESKKKYTPDYYLRKEILINHLWNKSIFCYQTGQIKKAIEAHNLLQRNRNELKREQVIKKGNSAELLMKSSYVSAQQGESLKEANKRASSEQKMKKIYLVLWGGTILLFFILLLFIKNKRALEKRQQELLLEKKQLALQKIEVELLEAQKKQLVKESVKMEENLVFKEKDLEALALDIKRKQDVLKYAYQRLEEIVEKEGLGRHKAFRLFFVELSEKLDQDERLSPSQQNIEAINAAFFAKLKSKFPQLTESDLQLCALYRLGFSSKEVASTRNIAPESAKRGRSRLRKKLELTANDDLVLFLKGI